MCHFFLIPHYDTKHLQYIRGNAHGKSHSMLHFGKYNHVPKSHLFPHGNQKLFISNTVKLGWQRRQQIQQLTLCALSPASGE